MNSEANVLILSSSLKEKSTSRLAAQKLHEILKAKMVQVEFVDLKLKPFPLFEPDNRKAPFFREIQAQMIKANAIVLATPDYHGSYSGNLKNFLDYYWREMAGKLFGYICSSHEKGLLPMDHLRTAVRQCYGWSLPYGVSLSDQEVNTERTEITNPKIITRLDILAQDLISYGPLIQDQFKRDSANKQGFAGFY